MIKRFNCVYVCDFLKPVQWRLVVRLKREKHQLNARTYTIYKSIFVRCKLEHTHAYHIAMSTWLCVQGNSLQFISNQFNWLNIDTYAMNSFLPSLVCLLTHLHRCIYLCVGIQLCVVWTLCQGHPTSIERLRTRLRICIKVLIKLKFFRPSFKSILFALTSTYANKYPGTHTHAYNAQSYCGRSTHRVGFELNFCLSNWNAEGKYFSFSRILNWRNHNEIQWVCVCLSQRSPISPFVCVCI